MSDPCPSCREPLDWPSGDGCAAMNKHKEHSMSDYKQTRDAAGRVTSTFGKMLEGLTDDDLIDHIENLEKRLNAAYLKMDVLEGQIEKLQKAKGGKDE